MSFTVEELKVLSDKISIKTIIKPFRFELGGSYWIIYNWDIGHKDQFGHLIDAKLDDPISRSSDNKLGCECCGDVVEFIGRFAHYCSECYDIIKSSTIYSCTDDETEYVIMNCENSGILSDETEYLILIRIGDNSNNPTTGLFVVADSKCYSNASIQSFKHYEPICNYCCKYCTSNITSKAGFEVVFRNYFGTHLLCSECMSYQILARFCNYQISLIEEALAVEAKHYALPMELIPYIMLLVGNIIIS